MICFSYVLGPLLRVQKATAEALGELLTPPEDAQVGGLNDDPLESTPYHESQ